MSEAEERDYVIGTGDVEITRLGLQHGVWRERALSAWRRAGVKRGHTVVDLGCGPGYATLDLAEIVGPQGKVIAVDRSHRFLAYLARQAEARGFTNIELVEADVDEVKLDAGVADLIWTRWLLIFAPDPEAIIARLAPVLKPGGAWVLQEYVDYSSWRLTPESEAHQLFLEAICNSWRDTGGDPDVGRRLPAACAAAGLVAEQLEPIVHVVRPDDFMWMWLSSYAQTGPDRMVELGYLTAEQADAVRADWEAHAADPNAFAISPMLLEAIMRRPS